MRRDPRAQLGLGRSVERPAPQRAADAGEDFRPRPAHLARAAFQPLGPQAVEAAALGRRHVAHRGPAAGERQAAEPAATPAGPAEHRGSRSRSARDRAPAGAPPRPISDSPVRHTRGVELSREFALAPMAHHLRQRDLDRAHAFAAPAQGRGVGQCRRLVDADQRSGSAPRPSAPDRPSHRHGRRPRHRPGNGSCRRRSGCSAACRGTRRRASRCGRCRAARRDSASGPSRSPGRRGPVETVV